MPVAPLALDDLTWSSMVDAARRRIIAASAGTWTLHAPVDPGVTLLELFAWLLEQRAYWLDQVPDSVLRGVLTLLGEAPQPTRSAATVMALTDVRSQGHPYDIVAAGVELQREGQLPALVFTTKTDVALLPVKESCGSGRCVTHVGVIAFGQDRSVDLEHGRILRLLPADGQPGAMSVVLWLRSLASGPIAAPMSLLFELRTSALIPPQWSPDAADVPPPAHLTWSYRSNGQLVPFRPGDVEDGTGGFRRSGILRLAIPSTWDPDGPEDADHYRSYSLVIQTDAATFSAPPRVRQIVANAVVAHHRRRIAAEQHTLDWLPLPGGVIELRAADLPIESGVELSLEERVAGWQKWTAVSDLTFHGPDERMVVVDREARALRFGDGLTGRLPVLKDPTHDNARIDYETGGGEAGNMGADFRWINQPLHVVRALNVTPADGGADAEPLAAARERAALAIRRVDRAVTAADYETLARTTPGAGILRAHAAVGLHPLHPCPVPGAVTVFVLPDTPAEDEDDPHSESGFVAAPVTDPGALAAVRRRLDDARLVGTEVFVATARYVRPSLIVDLQAAAPPSADLDDRMTRRLRQFLDPLRGGNDGTGWPFGEPLRPSALMRQAQAAAGDEIQITRVAIDLGGRTEECADVSIGAHHLVALERVTVRVSATARAARGGLR